MDVNVSLQATADDAPLASVNIRVTITGGTMQKLGAAGWVIAGWLSMPAAGHAEFISYFQRPNTCSPIRAGLPCVLATGMPDIAAGPDGNLWFTEEDRPYLNSADSPTNWIGRITTSGEFLTRWPLDSSWSLGAIALGPDGNMWFCAQTNSHPPLSGLLGRVTPEGVIDVFTLPTADFLPANLAAGSDGRLWFTECQLGALNVCRVGALTPSSGQFYERALSGSVGGITSGPDGNLWINRGSTISRLSTQGQLTQFPVPTPNQAAGGITVGPDGNLWFTEVDASKVGRLTLTGAVTEFPVTAVFPGKIVAGTDGAMWFVEADALYLSRISLAGDVTSLPIFSSSITSGPDGNIWITEGQIGRLATSSSLVLGHGFAVGAAFLSPDGQVQPAHAVSLTPDSGYFWFFDPANIELVVKVLDGCSVNNHNWFFATGLTNVGVQIDVTDLLQGGDKTYSNPAGTAFTPIQDTLAFATCPLMPSALRSLPGR